MEDMVASAREGGASDVSAEESLWVFECRYIDKASTKEDTCVQGYGARGELPDMRPKDYGKTSRPAPRDSHAD